MKHIKNNNWWSVYRVKLEQRDNLHDLHSSEYCVTQWHRWHGTWDTGPVMLVCVLSSSRPQRDNMRQHRHRWLTTVMRHRGSTWCRLDRLDLLILFTSHHNNYDNWQPTDAGQLDISHRQETIFHAGQAIGKEIFLARKYFNPIEHK